MHCSRLFNSSCLSMRLRHVLLHEYRVLLANFRTRINTIWPCISKRFVCRHPLFCRIDLLLTTAIIVMYLYFSSLEIRLQFFTSTGNKTSIRYGRGTEGWAKFAGPSGTVYHFKESA
ncbi:hypothetical protein BDU57DRAFT_522699 [Ampelomyces quisqualis]|uniref:Uncharacterized protein n=1 Tax=Ampelomyces quisqualis TaxID=50730 RepID=A0A6A5QD83_AMPQU|nr:hypothetical protein BDU57DRAFT_522699 [Ampelomyces quisqualis]